MKMKSQYVNQHFEQKSWYLIKHSSTYFEKSNFKKDIKSVHDNLSSKSIIQPELLSFI